MPGSNRGSPCWIMRRHFDLLPGMDTNPVIRHDKRAAYLVRHMASDAARGPIHRAQTRMLRYGARYGIANTFFRTLATSTGPEAS